jgi:malonate-semialdehyde dehydrogenase (acetylating)/methylmalonate-semialdehyde dehydrogenase
MPDSIPEQVVDTLIGVAYGSAGERCMAISVAIVVSDIADDLLDLLIPKVHN